MSEKPETLKETIARLREITAKSDLAKMEDPLAELHFIRHGCYPEGHTGERWFGGDDAEPATPEPSADAAVQQEGEAERESQEKE